MKNTKLLKVIGVIGITFFIIISTLFLIYADLNNDSSFKTITGKRFNFDKLEGKVVIVNFWATWCGPCLIEIPNLMELKEEYKDEAFEIVGISTDEFVEDVIDFNKYQKFNYPVLMANEKIYKRFTPPMGIPFSIILDKNGNTSTILVGYKTKEAFITEIEKLL